MKLGSLIKGWWKSELKLEPRNYLAPFYRLPFSGDPVPHLCFHSVNVTWWQRWDVGRSLVFFWWVRIQFPLHSECGDNQNKVTTIMICIKPTGPAAVFGPGPVVHWPRSHSNSRHPLHGLDQPSNNPWPEKSDYAKYAAPHGLYFGESTSQLEELQTVPWTATAGLWVRVWGHFIDLHANDGFRIQLRIKTIRTESVFWWEVFIQHWFFQRFWIWAQSSVLWASPWLGLQLRGTPGILWRDRIVSGGIHRGD